MLLDMFQSCQGSAREMRACCCAARCADAPQALLPPSLFSRHTLLPFCLSPPFSLSSLMPFPPPAFLPSSLSTPPACLPSSLSSFMPFSPPAFQSLQPATAQALLLFCLAPLQPLSLSSLPPFAAERHLALWHPHPICPLSSNYLINQASNQAINQSINQSINQYV